MENFRRNSIVLLLSLATLGIAEQSKGELTISPAPILEGVKGIEVPVQIKILELGKEGKNFEKFLRGGDDKTNVYLLEISSDTPYWLDYNSSMGQRSRGILMEWVQNTLLKKYKENEKLNAIEEEVSMLHSFFGGATKNTLQEGVGAISNFIGNLLHPYEDTATIERSFYSTSLTIDPFSQRLFSLIIVDPKPMSGPDNKTFLIIVESVYEE